MKKTHHSDFCFFYTRQLISFFLTNSNAAKRMCFLVRRPVLQLLKLFIV